jgi:hypothetical protein
VQGFVLVLLLLLPAVVWHVLVPDVGRAALLATLSMGFLIAGINWDGAWSAALGNFLGGCLLGLVPALAVGAVASGMDGRRRELAEERLATGGRRRHLVGGFGALAIGVAGLARFGWDDDNARAVLGFAGFIALGVATLAWLYATRKKNGT